MFFIVDVIFCVCGCMCVYIYMCIYTRYMYSHWTVTVRTSWFGAWGLITRIGNSPPIQKGAPAVMQHCLISQQKNSECCELRAWKQSPLNSDRVLILIESLTWTDQKLAHSTVCEIELCAHVSYLSHSAGIQIFHNISIFAFWLYFILVLHMVVFYFLLSSRPTLAMLGLMCVCVCVLGNVIMFVTFCNNFER